MTRIASRWSLVLNRFYTSEDGQSQVQLRADPGTVWLTQLEMAELFNASKQNISLHLKNIYDDGELQREATTEDSSAVQPEGVRICAVASGLWLEGTI